MNKAIYIFLIYFSLLFLRKTGTVLVLILRLPPTDWRCFFVFFIIPPHLFLSQHYRLVRQRQYVQNLHILNFFQFPFFEDIIIAAF
ncbi:MAG: hypothetical protein CVU78_05680 [Elusimicrobia bacterium HGW-Elusimicrobia-2]|nr:MAG: hypothetical protein CVU78_05680 [Elusimicrobia bacterium HGW-Elusimicrobia-2]